MQARPAKGGAGLVFDEALIRRVARAEGPKGSLAALFLRQKWRELVVRAWQRIGFRRRDNRLAQAAYNRMRAFDLEGINLLQAWANWRLIPRSLSGHLPSRPLSIVDLCCGIGDSTRALAYYTPPRSRIVGLDCNQDFVAAARARTYVHSNGRRARVTFDVQDALQPLRVDGELIEDASIDLVNAVGVIACHFDTAASQILAAECARVVRRGGLATLDAGPAGTRPSDLIRIMSAAGFEHLGTCRSCWVTRHRHLCFRRCMSTA